MKSYTAAVLSGSNLLVISNGAATSSFGYSTCALMLGELVPA